MSVSSRTGGTAIAAFGLVLAVFHVRTVGVLWGAPARVVVNGLVPLLLSVAVVAAGVQFARGDVVADQFVARVLAWVGVGVVVLGLATAWMFASILVTEPLPSNASLTLLNAATLGGLIGYLVGVYDARRRRQQVRVDQLNRINDTLRIATREIVNAETRSELEQQVCERLQQSEPYESAWIGRYDPGDSELRPNAWAGLDDDYYESVVITVDEDDEHGQGAGGRAIRTGEIQYSQDVKTDPSMEPWRELFAEHGVESVAVVPLTDDDTVHGILSVYADRPYVFDAPEREVLMELGETIGHAITSFEAREQLRRRERELASQNDRLEEFASVVSHDLRNPMNVAEGSISLEREERDSDALRRAADALTRMNELVEDILALARTGQLVSEFDSVDLRAVVEDAWATTETEAATLDVEPSLGTVSGDESRIRELFENLFRNAVEHGSTGPASQTRQDAVEHGSTDPQNAERSEDAVEHSSTNPRSHAHEGAVEHGSTSPASQARQDSVEHADDDVTVSVGSLDDADGFYVADDGPGIPPADRKTVFDVGYSTATDGTGFGLNIVRSIADAHGWDVAITESDAGGTRFEFTGVETEVGRPVDEQAT